MIYGFVMAAGASRRFGDIKQLAKIDGVSMVRRSYNILNKVLKGRTYLVLGSNAEFIVRDFQEVNTISVFEGMLNFLFLYSFDNISKTLLISF